MSTLRSAISLLYTVFEEVLVYKDLIAQIQNIIAYFIDTNSIVNVSLQDLQDFQIIPVKWWFELNLPET